MDLFIYILIRLLDVYQLIILVACILSFIRPNPYNPFVRIIYKLTEPVFDFVRRVLPLRFSMIDLSPMIVIFGIYLIKMILIKIL